MNLMRLDRAHPDVLVVGAGPTGLTAALVLAASGVPCRIIERRVGPSTTSRALGLQARSMEVLAGLDVARRVERVAYRLTGASVMRGDTEYVNLPWVPPASPYPYTYVLPQAGLEEILRERLAELGALVQTGVEVSSVEQAEGRVRIDLTDGSSIESDWLVGADGSRSTVRGALGIAFPGRATGETYHLADAVLSLHVPFRDSALWLGPEGPLMLMRLPGGEGLWRVFVDVTDTARGRDVPEWTASGLADLLAARGPSGVRVQRLDWTSVFRTRVRLAESYRSGRAFLAGDAAHVFPPFGGQGMNLGIQDAVNLGWRIASVRRGAPATLLDDYERERRPVARDVTREVEARRRTFALRNSTARRLRDVALRLGGGSRRGAKSASLANSQLKINYRHAHRAERPRSRLAAHGTGPAVRVGDRAPQGRYAGETVHDLFAPDHATLLRFVPEAEGDVDDQPGLRSVTIGRTEDPDGSLAAAYGCADGGTVLVRPDGYVGARGGPSDQLEQETAELTGVSR